MIQPCAPLGCTAFAVARQTCHAKQSYAGNYCQIADVGYATAGDTGKTAGMSPTSTGTTGHTYSQTADTSPVGGTKSGPAISTYPTGPGTDQSASKTSSQVQQPFPERYCPILCCSQKGLQYLQLLLFACQRVRHGSADQPKGILGLQVNIMLNLQTTSQP